MTKINIIQFIPEQNEKDFNLLMAAFLRIWNAAENLKHLSYIKHPFSEDTIQAWLRHHVSKGISYYCATDEHDKIIAISIIQEHPIRGLMSLGIAVQPEKKHQGIGSMLIEHLVTYGLKKDYPSIEISVFADNIRMLRLLLKHGFIPVRMVHHKRYDGADIVYMKYTHV